MQWVQKAKIAVEYSKDIRLYDNLIRFSLFRP